MVPGKKYKPEDFLWMAWNRKWFIIIPTLLIAAGTFVYARSLPNRYVSSTTILVVPQRVPESYVRSTVTVPVAQRLQTIAQQILSRTKLERIIEDLDLYREDRETMIMEDLVEKMRNVDIKIDVGPGGRDGGGHFSVGYESPDPRMAMQVADRLARMFMQENSEEREVLADSTNQFLQSQLDDARRRLIEHEARLVTFRQQNSGRLPTQVTANLSMMQVTQSQIQANSDALVHENDRLTGLDANIAQALEEAKTAPVVAADNPQEGPASQRLEAARNLLTGLEQRLKPTHPDISRTKRIIAELEAEVAEQALKESAMPASAKAEASGPPALINKISAWRAEAEQLRRSVAIRRAEDERLNGVLRGYTGRLDAAPQLESEMTELMRDYDTLQSQYRSLLQKSEDSKIALNLERRQIGEQFSVIDGARLPEKPVSPNRLQLNLQGLLAGLGFGLALVALLEYRDTTLKTDEDIVTSLALPVLAVIPAMIPHSIRSREKRRRLILGVSMSVATVLVAVVFIAWRMQWLPRWGG